MRHSCYMIVWVSLFICWLSIPSPFLSDTCKVGSAWTKWSFVEPKAVAVATGWRPTASVLVSGLYGLYRTDDCGMATSRRADMFIDLKDDPRTEVLRTSLALGDSPEAGATELERLLFSRRYPAEK